MPFSVPLPGFDGLSMTIWLILSMLICANSFPSARGPKILSLKKSEDTSKCNRCRLSNPIPLDF